MILVRKFINFCIYFLYLIISVVIILEIIFRILPTTTPVDLEQIFSENEILRFKPNRTGTLSLGSNFYKTVEKKTNNYGFYASYDFIANSKPDIVVIGDSFVEAAQIKNQDTFGEILNNENKKLLVYQLGISGVSLSQYLKMIQYAKKEFSPKHFVIVIVGNDFDQSLCSYRIKEGTWCFNDRHELVFVPFEGYSTKRRLMRNLAFARYIVFNLKVEWRPIAAKLGIKDPAMKADREFAGNTERFKSDEIYERSKKVVESFFDELKKLGVANKTSLIIAADHNDIYVGSKTNSYFRDMRQVIMDKADIYNVNYIDLATIFQNDYKQFKIKFDFPTDGHWNEHAHNLVANAFLNLRNK